MVKGNRGVGSGHVFKEGDSCDSGEITGTLLCAQTPTAALDATTCPMNKSNPIYASKQGACP